VLCGGDGVELFGAVEGDEEDVRGGEGDEDVWDGGRRGVECCREWRGGHFEAVMMAMARCGFGNVGGDAAWMRG